MKKLIFVLILSLVTSFCVPQTTSPIAPRPVYKVATIDTTKQTVVSKDSLKQFRHKIHKKESEVKELKQELVVKQDSLAEQIAVSESVISGLKDGTISFFKLIRWLYILIFMIVSWVFNDGVDATNTATKLNWLSKVPKMLRSFMMGIIIAVIFYWAFGYNTRLDVFSLFCSLLSGMVLYKIGVDKIFKAVSEKWLNLKFDTKSESINKNINSPN